MSSDNPQNVGGGAGHRRSSITQAALSNLFQRGPPTASTGPPFSSNGAGNDPQRRRLSITTIGLSGTSPTNKTSFVRRGSMSTNSNSDSIDESAIEDEDAPSAGARTASNTPFVRHMSFGAGPAARGIRQGGSPGNGKAPTSPPSSLGRSYSGHKAQRLPSQSLSYSQAPGHSITAALSAVGRRASLNLPASSSPQASNTKHSRVSSDNAHSRVDQYGFNWSEQLRSRAESSVTGARPSFSFPSGAGSHSPPRTGIHHDRTRSVSDMPQPPAQASSVRPKQQDRPKPDAFQERILKGDFYMD